jgi:hypothetical protein
MVKVLQAKLKGVGFQMREVMFGDLPWDEWCRREGPLEAPWPLFRAAWTAKKNGDLEGSCACLEQVVSTLGFETRHYVQAWHYLRELGRPPSPAEAKDVLGVIIEKGMKEGLDVFGAYDDHTARYWSYRGTGILWDQSNDLLDDEIEALFESARLAVEKIRPRVGPRPPPPAPGEFQISFLTPSGVHFGRGTEDVLSVDPLAEEVLERATTLMRRLTDLKQSA